MQETNRVLLVRTTRKGWNVYHGKTYVKDLYLGSDQIPLGADPREIYVTVTDQFVWHFVKIYRQPLQGRKTLVYKPLQTESIPGILAMYVDGPGPMVLYVSVRFMQIEKDEGIYVVQPETA
ncbi:MAG: hypothetical protein M1459_01055 [Patescibacteria group bacterium]|nr:hypothetical protein [Patescibacteria group bacterium]